MPPTAPTKEYRVIGTRPVRPDGADKVTGRAQFGADIRLPGMLYGRIKRSPHAHRIIKKIDSPPAPQAPPPPPPPRPRPAEGAPPPPPPPPPPRRACRAGAGRARPCRCST